MAAPASLLLVGNGKMGSALLARWQANKPAHIDRFFVIGRRDEELASDIIPTIIVFAVKPQQLAALLPDYAGRFGSAPLYLSVAAGKTLAFYQQQLGEQARIIRAMPNTPTLIGQGVTALCASLNCTAADKQLATQLMHATGHAEWLDDERLMNAVTALSGCGPAYVFLFLESLTNAAVALGLPETLAKALAVQTVSGSAALAALNDADFAALRRQVASPGGSTEAALKVLMHDDQLEHLVAQAMQQAHLRAEELAE